MYSHVLVLCESSIQKPQLGCEPLQKTGLECCQFFSDHEEMGSVPQISVMSLSLRSLQYQNIYKSNAFIFYVENFDT